MPHSPLPLCKRAYASATKTYTTTGAGLTSGIPGIEAKDPKNAKITFDGKSYEVAARSTHSLPYGTTEWKIIVQNSLNTETYKLNQSDFKTKLDGYFANAGLKCLGFTQGASFRQFSSNKKLTSIEDFKGLNMRVMDNQYQIKFWSDIGCNTTPVPGSELYMSLQNGLVDSQENALDTVVVGGMHEVQDYITLTNHTLYTNMMVMSESYFNSLPAAYQEIIENAVAETTVEMIPVYQEADQTAYDTLIESGMKINELSAEDMAAMREIAQPVYDMVRSEIGDEAVDALVSVIQ